mgnify:CR=1 FL=1
MKYQNNILIVTLLFCFIWSYTSAQHAEDGHDGEEHAHYHTHHIAVFNGLTSNFTHNNTAYSVGMDYEYRFSRFIGAGLLTEYIATEEGEILGGLPLFLHLTKGLKVTLAPLLVNKKEHHEDHDHHGEENRVTNFAFRLGAGYGFHVGKLSIAPSINFDMGESSALVYGINIGLGF